MCGEKTIDTAGHQHIHAMRVFYLRFPFVSATRFGFSPYYIKGFSFTSTTASSNRDWQSSVCRVAPSASASRSGTDRNQHRN